MDGLGYSLISVYFFLLSAVENVVLHLFFVVVFYFSGFSGFPCFHEFWGEKYHFEMQEVQE